MSLEALLFSKLSILTLDNPLFGLQKYKYFLNSQMETVDF